MENGENILVTGNRLLILLEACLQCYDNEALWMVRGWLIPSLHGFKLHSMHMSLCAQLCLSDFDIITDT